MNVNLLPPAPITIKQWLETAVSLLNTSGIHSARLDALILLEDELNKDRSWILAHDDHMLSSEQLRPLHLKLQQRARFVPLAYIRGFIEFYGRRFAVNPRVLIPRPETEELIDLLKALPHIPAPTIGPSILIDIGTGSGCIGVTAKLERPELEVYLTDIDENALGIANHNGRLHDVRLQYYPDDLLEGHPDASYSIITANLPYVAKDYEISPDARAEPDLALFAEDGGYELIERLLPQAARCLLPGGYLLLESDPWQQDRILTRASEQGFVLREQRRFHLVMQKVSC